MRKIVLAVIAVLSLTYTQAQEVQFGAKAGVNFANLTGDDADGADARTSFHVGAVAEIKINEKFSVQPELLYSSQGASTKDKFEGITFESTLKLDYINVPIMAKYYVADSFSLEVGPQIGFLVAAEAEYSMGGESETEDIKDQLKTVDFGLNFGLGYKLDNGINFGARYNFGLSNIGEDSDSDLKNSVFQISVGYLF
jgi:hypothetical protein